jgi:hypothetical protein
MCSAAGAKVGESEGAVGSSWRWQLRSAFLGAPDVGSREK